MVEDGTRRCERCGLTKSTSEFDYRSDARRLRRTCKDCRRTYQRGVYVRKHPPKELTEDPLGSEGLKRCSRCREIKPICSFPPVRRGQPKRQSWCRDCFASYGVIFYQKNRAAQKARLVKNTNARRDANRRRVIDYLSAHPCVDCHERDVVVLEFDHLRDKEFDIAVLVNSGATWSRIEREIEKCDVRCANCHRRVTRERRRSRSRHTHLLPPAPSVAPFIEQLLLEDAYNKICRRCGQLKPVHAFPFRSKSKRTRRSTCLECQREYAHLWYVRTRSPHAKRNRGYGEKTIEANCKLISEYLLQHPCVDCGEDDLVVLDFDHVRGVKRADVSTLARSGEPWDVVRAEIEKCEVRCANCHRRVTVKRANSYRARMTIHSVDLVA